MDAPGSGDAAREAASRVGIPEWAMHDIEVPHWALTEAVCVFEAMIAMLDQIAETPGAEGQAVARERADDLRDLRGALWQADRPALTNDDSAQDWLAALRTVFAGGIPAV